MEKCKKMDEGVVKRKMYDWLICNMHNEKVLKISHQKKKVLKLRHYYTPNIMAK